MRGDIPGNLISIALPAVGDGNLVQLIDRSCVQLCYSLKCQLGIKLHSGETNGDGTNRNQFETHVLKWFSSYKNITEYFCWPKMKVNPRS